MRLEQMLRSLINKILVINQKQIKMKNYKFYGLLVALTLIVASCEQEDIGTTFDVDGGQTAISFTTSNFSTSVPDTDLNFQVPVNVTTVSSQERTYTASVVSADNASEFSLGNVVIPAGEYNGNLSVNFDFSAITGADGDLKEVVISLVPPAGGTAYNETVTISYFRAIICNDPVLTFAVDTFGEESGFQILDSDGTVVFDIPVGSFGRPPAGTVFTISIPTLPDGMYTAVLIDSYGDGQDDSGGYSIDCSISNLATGGGVNFGNEQRVDFFING